MKKEVPAEVTPKMLQRINQACLALSIAHEEDPDSDDTAYCASLVMRLAEKCPTAFAAEGEA